MQLFNTVQDQPATPFLKVAAMAHHNSHYTQASLCTWPSHNGSLPDWLSCYQPTTTTPWKGQGDRIQHAIVQPQMACKVTKMKWP